MEVDSSSNFESIKNGPLAKLVNYNENKGIAKKFHQWEMFNLY